MKIVLLMPALNKDNTREKNNSCIDTILSQFKFDEVVIYDQGFCEADFRSDCTYIGHKPDPAGFIEPRNSLLTWFYESDYDWSFWLDANSSIPKPCYNDLHSLLHQLRNNEAVYTSVDSIFSTLGIIPDTNRVTVKQEFDYFDKLTLLPCKNDRSTLWFHGLWLSNLNKKYGVRPLIDPFFDPRKKKGLDEDIYFTMLLKRFFNAYVAPTMCISKPDSNFSTHQNDGTGKYNYAKPDYVTTDKYVSNLSYMNYKNPIQQPFKLDRVETNKDDMKPYVSRAKKTISTGSKSLFV